MWLIANFKSGITKMMTDKKMCGSANLGLLGGGCIGAPKLQEARVRDSREEEEKIGVMGE